MQLVDTHCHIHSSDYSLDAETVYQKAMLAGVMKMICVGTDAEDSGLAAKWALGHKHAWASVGVHPHVAKLGTNGLEDLLKNQELASKIAAIGEVGLDYHYLNSPKVQQITMLETQLRLAKKYDLPLIFHVRDAFEDFWPIFSQFKGLKGVLHSFTDSLANLERALAQGLFVGVNGIATFTKDQRLIDTYQKIPLERLLLETDAPYLTPEPWRGKVNEPAYVRLVAERLGQLRSTAPEIVALSAFNNAIQLFHI